MAIDHSQFPDLARIGYRVTSPPDPTYNCIGWAAGVADTWWWPDPGGYDYWPPGVPRQETLDAFIRAFETLGYVPCPDGTPEAGWQKVALYALSGIPTHAARQLPGGRWTSKLGPEDDIEHDLDGLVGPLYGVPIQILRRPHPSA
jgi:hypothetical protein